MNSPYRTSMNLYALHRILWLFAVIVSFLATGCNKDPHHDDLPDNKNTVKDLDGNQYGYVQIGTQTWMASNLKTTRFSDGSPIPLVTEDTVWSVLKEPGYCWYENDAAKYRGDYGALYNYYAAESGKLCPTGWRVPSKDDWTILADALGGDTAAGGSLKEKGTAHWHSPNAGADNQSGFSARPGGNRTNGCGGTFGGLYTTGYWWTSTKESQVSGWFVTVSYLDTYVRMMSGARIMGASVRCVKE
jgi:uncharacterized protein (TIGR02145 family)